MLRKLFSFFNLRKPNADEPPPEPALFSVAVSATSISVTRPDGGTEAVDWADLDAVINMTNDSIPTIPAAFWLLMSSETACIVPHGATGETQLIERLQKLSGFDNEQLSAAMRGAETGRFICWQASTQVKV